MGESRLRNVAGSNPPNPLPDGYYARRPRQTRRDHYGHHRAPAPPAEPEPLTAEELIAQAVRRWTALLAEEAADT